MKKILIALMLSLSSLSFACPDLSGLYWRCISTSDMDIHDIKNAYVVLDEKGSLTLGMMIGTETEVANYIVDGITRTSTMDIEGNNTTIDTTASCDENSVTITTKVHDFDMTEETILSKDSNNNLVMQNIFEGYLFNTTTCRSMN